MAAGVTSLKAGADNVAKAADAVKDVVQGLAGLVVSVTRSGTTYESQTTASLNGVAQRLNAQLSQISPNSGLQIKDATYTNDYGAAPLFVCSGRLR